MLHLIYSFIIFALVAIDQFSKNLVVSYLKLNESIKIIDGFFSIHYVQNFGAGFSIMQNQRTFFLILTPIAVAGFIYFLFKTNKNAYLEKTAYLLMIAGSLGNFIDRLLHTYVVDFLDFIIINYDFPVFNIADSFLTIGVILLLIAIIMEEHNAKNQTNNR